MFFQINKRFCFYRFPPTRGAALVGLAALGALGALAAGFAAGAAFFEVVAFWVRLTSLAALK